MKYWPIQWFVESPSPPFEVIRLRKKTKQNKSQRPTFNILTAPGIQCESDYIGFISSSELCSRIKALYRKTWYLNNPFHSVHEWRPGAGFMRDICARVTPNFGRKSSAPGRKSKKAESFGFMSGAQEILPCSGAKLLQKNSRSIYRCARANQQTKWRFPFMTVMQLKVKNLSENREFLETGQIHLRHTTTENFLTDLELERKKCLLCMKSSNQNWNIPNLGKVHCLQFCNW